MSRLRPRVGFSGYRQYAPTITRGQITSGAVAAFAYNHDASIIKFQGNWLCLWNASTGGEGIPPQYIVQSSSDDFLAWTTPAICFSDADLANNPVTVAPSGLQWQPGTIVIDGVLHALWSQSNTGAGTFVSRLSTLGGKWTNEELNVTPITIESVVYQEVFITGDPVELASGRVVCPAILLSYDEIPVPPGVTDSSFYRRLKLAGVLLSDDRGASWQVGGTTTVLSQAGCVWEPMISLRSDGSVRLFVRNLYGEQASTEMLLSATSTDDCDTFSALSFYPIETISTRGAIVNRELSDAPSVMVFNDNVKLGANPIFTADRRCLSLFVSGDGDTYLPGAEVSDDNLDIGACYPSARLDGGKLYVVYSTYQTENGSASDIRSVVVDPAPAYSAAPPRRNSSRLFTPSVIASPHIAFDYGLGMLFATTSTAAALDASLFSCGAFFQSAATTQAIVDSRFGTSGLLLKVIQDGALVLGLYNGATYTETTLGVNVPFDEPCYVGLSLDGAGGSVTAYVVDQTGAVQSDTVALGFTVANLNSDGQVYLGTPRTNSRLNSFNGPVAFLKIYGAALTQNQHRYLQAYGAARAGTTVWSGATTAPSTAAVDLDATDSHAGTNDANWLARFDATGLRNGNVTESGGEYTISGNGSVSILPAALTIPGHYLMRYQAITGQTSDLTIATVGSAATFAEVVRSAAGEIKARLYSSGSYGAFTALGKAGGAGETRNIRIKIEASACTIWHEGCQPYVIGEGLDHRVFAGKGFLATYLSAINSFKLLK